MSKSRGDCGIYDQRPGRQTDPQNMPTYLCPVGFSQSWMCTYVHKHIQGLLEPTRKQGSVFYKHLILKCLWNGCSGAAMGKNCRKMKRGPFLNWIAFPWLQSISESWFFVLFFGKLAWHAAHGRHGHTGVFWVLGQGVGASFPKKPLQRERKLLAATWYTASK